MKNYILLFIFALPIWASNGFAQTEMDTFLKAYQTKFLKGEKLNISINDAQNGYMFGCLPLEGEKDCSMESYSYAFAVWKTAKGDKIWGVFRHACGGMGCWGQNMGDLRFYDNMLMDITNNVYDIRKAQKEADATELKIDGNNDVDALQRNIYAEIPRKGTTIQLTVGLVGVVSKNFASLIFDKSTGKFELIKK